MFDPFERRVSRDIRNRLSQAFLDALEGKGLTELEKTAAQLRQSAPDGAHTDFIDSRQAVYHTVYHAGQHRTKIEIAYLLWEHGLFFECHEWVEALWVAAGGDEKTAFQAIIRAAGAHVLAEAGRTAPAASSARKALALINAHRTHLPSPFDPTAMIKGLERLTSYPRQ